MNRTTEMVLGIIGGIIGFGAAFIGLTIGAVDAELSGNEGMLDSGAAAFWFAAIGIVGAIAVKFKAKIGGALMIAAGAIILYNTGLFGVLPALLLIPAGLMGLLRKDKTKTTQTTVEGQ